MFLHLLILPSPLFPEKRKYFIKSEFCTINHVCIAQTNTFQCLNHVKCKHNNNKSNKRLDEKKRDMLGVISFKK